MNKKLEVFLAVLALAGLYSAMPESRSQPASSGIRAEQTVVVADGSDPMPLCRGRRCNQKPQ
jgi:hypothetical protein